jgi:hypothetical protein
MVAPARTRSRSVVAASALLVAAIAGCSAGTSGSDADTVTVTVTDAGNGTGTDTATTAPEPPLTPAPTKPPPQVRDATPPAGGSLYAPGDIDPGLQPWIDEAVDDLATRLGVEASAVSVSAAVLVTWPDSSLGCPQPGMEYLQVLTDGAIIELATGDVIYRYHAGEGSGPFLCTTPITTAPAPAG